MKQHWKPGNMLYPLPAVMVSCGANEKEHNIITVSWTGTINTNPPMCYVSIRKERHSHAIIKENGEFVINLTTENLLRAADWCGVKSGKKFDKFREMNLTKEGAQVVNVPLIAESPVNIECKVTEIKELGSHDMFLAEVVAVNVDDTYLDDETGLFKLFDAKLINYSHGNYYKQGGNLGKFGFSSAKKKKKGNTKPKQKAKPKVKRSERAKEKSKKRVKK